MDNVESSDLLAALSDAMADAVEKVGTSVVRVNGRRRRPASFVGRDPSSDLAVLSVEGLDVEAAASAEGEPRIGQLALAVGGPGRGEGPRASLGVVSSVGGPMRTWRGPRLERYIQTDATPYPGFSGC